jgi:predicted PurR-regulated permease PerM
MRDAPLLNLVLALGLVLMVGWLLVIGQAIILPVVMAIIAVYVVTTAAEALERVPLIGRLPDVARRGLVLGLPKRAAALPLRRRGALSRQRPRRA